MKKHCKLLLKSVIIVIVIIIIVVVFVICWLIYHWLYCGKYSIDYWHKKKTKTTIPLFQLCCSARGKTALLDFKFRNSLTIQQVFKIMDF